MVIKILEENISNKLFNITLSKYFWIWLFRQGEQKDNTKQMELIKLQSLSQQRKPSTKQATSWIGNIYQYSSSKELISKIHKELVQVNTQKPTWWKNWQRPWIESSPKRTYEYRWPTYMKRDITAHLSK